MLAPVECCEDTEYSHCTQNLAGSVRKHMFFPPSIVTDELVCIYDLVLRTSGFRDMCRCCALRRAGMLVCLRRGGILAEVGRR